ncbi:transcriptional regulator [Canicola haemoglobinophilus]|uniref:Transcriptional regulatory protein n=1 Tax=Canicola haemoglobinophilus TaxID=733 RepID=A0A1V4AYE0_9PAST|nr:helix-turn-helix transcriptional regulator [Canicola haemoglobinophilus]OOR96760.1 transcriptional regulator [Canicola haemoglobinophilus]STO54769.1 transcriptional regulatory protein [Canicola haemoglobinophilus]STO55054.1 transcriptional regulatory protein [Canicola haemoglobinophilus]STO59196.1 transcriptional regulatory protein [Canicola haemoglobinophilus]STO59767.1 transcriptional regulatory protein [Canicola haemoglobinophilus]
MSKEDNFPERIDFVINKLNGPSEFARQTGVTLSTIARWRKGEAEPSRPNLVRIAEATGVSIQWLATGEEEPKKTIERSVERVKALTEEAVTMIASYSSINVSAGFGSFNEGVTKPDGQEPYFDSLLQSLRVNPENCAVFWANGDSMYPTIDDGDQLLVDLSKNEMKGSDKIYLVQNGESVWVKRVKMKWDGIDLISDNKEEYPPIAISGEDAQNLQIIGQVVHIGKSLV